MSGDRIQVSDDIDDVDDQVVFRVYDPPHDGEVLDAACRLADTVLLCYRAGDVTSLHNTVTKVITPQSYLKISYHCLSIFHCSGDTTLLCPWSWLVVKLIRRLLGLVTRLWWRRTL